MKDARTAVETFLTNAANTFGRPYADGFSIGYLKGSLSEAIYLLSLYNEGEANRLIKQLETPLTK